MACVKLITASIFILVACVRGLYAQPIDFDPEHEYPHTPLEAQQRSFWLRMQEPVTGIANLDTAAWDYRNRHQRLVLLQAAIHHKVDCAVQAGYLYKQGARVPRGYCRTFFHKFGLGAGSFSLRWLDGWAISGAGFRTVRWGHTMVFQLRPLPRAYNYQAVGGAMLDFHDRRFSVSGFGGVLLGSMAHYPFAGDTLTAGLRVWGRPAKGLGIEAAFVDYGFHRPSLLGGVRLGWLRRIRAMAVFSYRHGRPGGAFMAAGGYTWTLFSVEAFGLWVTDGFFSSLGRVFSPYAGGRGPRGPLHEAGVKGGFNWHGLWVRLLLDTRGMAHTSHVSIGMQSGFRSRFVRVGLGVDRDWVLRTDRKYYGTRTWGIRCELAGHYRGIHAFIEGNLRLLRYSPMAGQWLAGLRWGLHRARIEVGFSGTHGVYPGTSWQNSMGVWTRFDVRLWRHLRLSVSDWVWRANTKQGHEYGWSARMAMIVL